MKQDIPLGMFLTENTFQRVLSNPIVTPVTDEFPTEERDESKKRDEDEKEKDKKEQKTGAGKLTPVKNEDLVDYAAKKKKKGLDVRLATFH